jgi:hypothetical protein
VGRCRFVRPNTVTLPLSEGDWIVVKERLNAGEQRALVERSWHDTPDADGQFHVNPPRAGLALLTAYLIDWSFTDHAGDPVPIRGLSAAELERVIDNLEPPDYNELRNAINAHTEALYLAREAEKKRMAGASASSPTSPSLDVVTGAMSG